MKKRGKPKKIYRKCLVCGKRICITLYPNGQYSNGHYFGRMKFPIEGTGKYVKIGTSKILGDAVEIVKWTGKKDECEYWECNACYGSPDDDD